MTVEEMLTLEKVLEKKVVLTDTIKKLCEDFTKETHLNISDIHLYAQEYLGEPLYTYLIDISIKI